MGRRINPRDGHYDQDATVCLRISRAVEQDGTVLPEWRGRVTAKLREVVSLLLAPQRTETSMGRPKKVG